MYNKNSDALQKQLLQQIHTTCTAGFRRRRKKRRNFIKIKGRL